MSKSLPNSSRHGEVRSLSCSLHFCIKLRVDFACWKIGDPSCRSRTSELYFWFPPPLPQTPLLTCGSNSTVSSLLRVSRRRSSLAPAWRRRLRASFGPSAPEVPLSMDTFFIHFLCVGTVTSWQHCLITTQSVLDCLNLYNTSSPGVWKTDASLSKIKEKGHC